MKRPGAGALLCATGPACNNHCTVCPVAQSASAPGGASLVARLRDGRAAGLRTAVLAGGEPLLRRDVFRLLRAARELGLETSVVTNGRLLVYEAVRQRLADSGCGHVRVQLFGGTQAAHDAITRAPGSFEQAMGGVEAFQREHGDDVQVEIGLALTGDSAGDVDDAVERIAARLPFFEIGIFVSILSSPGAAEDLGSMRSAVDRLAGWNARRPLRPLLAWEGAPPAIVSPPRHLRVDPPIWSGWCGQPDAPAPGRFAPPDPVAGSFDYVRTHHTVARVDHAEDCEADRTALTTDRERDLWLVAAEKLVLHRTDTSEFRTEDIARVKWDSSDLYLARAAPAALGDSAGTRRRVRPDPLCASCSRRDSCARRFVMVEEPEPHLEDRWLTLALRRMRGRVLDVSGDEQVYRELIRALVRDRLVEHHGVTRIEDDEPAAGYFDYVLALRAPNRFTDVPRALSNMTRALRPGGSMMLTGCTPFALLRDPGDASSAGTAPRATRQRVRNFSSFDFWPEIRLLPLRVIFHRPVSLETANQWILQAMKI